MEKPGIACTIKDMAKEGYSINLNFTQAAILNDYIEHLESRAVPNLFWDANDWECTYEDLCDITEYLDLNDIMEIGCAARQPSLWAACVPKTFDEHGDCDESEVQCFASEEEARQALQTMELIQRRHVDDGDE